MAFRLNNPFSCLPALSCLQKEGIQWHLQIRCPKLRLMGCDKQNANSFKGAWGTHLHFGDVTSCFTQVPAGPWGNGGPSSMP